ncbi:hypothetical protein SDC9_55758 [bioreactor metagenome]|uniref:Lipocalin-like domain-containing protein n=1 Tax=bioreactor metagenome TaxID=1076179 RepID=A0A644X0M8_9ZZZZ
MKAPLIITSLLLFVFVSCSRDDSVQVANRINEGSWKITYYYDKDHDETADYSGLTFDFNDDGSVTATNSSSSYQGTWSTGNDDSSDKLYLTFGNPDLLMEISDDWIILDQSSSKIELKDDSDSGTELLTFEKI